MSQTECLTCGRDIRDALRLELVGRYCSERCYHARGLPALLHRGA